MASTRKQGAEDHEDIVNWDGVLSPEERQRIVARIRSAFGAVGARIPDIEVIDGERLNLRDLVFDYIGKERPTEKDIERADRLADGLEKKVRELEERLRGDELSERAAVELMREALGVLRALQQLRGLRDPDRGAVARSAVLNRVDDERRWLDFMKNVKR
jgi:hypothetical protein